MVVYLCVLALRQTRLAMYALARQGRDRSQVIQCISLVGETGDEDTCYQTAQLHSLKVKCLGSGLRAGSPS